MDLPPDLPPSLAYLHRAPTAQCVTGYSRQFAIPVAVTLAIMKTEGGHPGSYNRNTNGTYDMGVMQLNTVHVEDYARKYGMSEYGFKTRAVHDGCFSVYVGLDLLRRHLDESGNLATAVAHYHSKTPELGAKYLKRFSRNLRAVMAGRYPALAGLRIN